jgi:O-antigen ligase
MFVAITPNLHGGLEIFRIIILSLSPIIIYLLKPFSFKKLNLYSFLLFGILFVYFLSFILNNQNYVNFLLGKYQRNFGFLILLGTYLLFFIAATQKEFVQAKSEKILVITLLIAIVYGFIQIAGFDFIPTETNENGLTLGNINFGSSFLGLLSIVPLMLGLQNIGIKRYLFLSIFILDFILVLSLGASQGFIFILISSLIALTYYIQKIRISLKTKIIVLAVSILTPFIVFVFYLQSIEKRSQGNVYSYIDSILQITSRLDHWSLAIRIGLDHKWFGVGIDDMFKFSGQYINESMAVKYQGVVLPDKAHNLILDHFVNGGLFAMTFWAIFCITILVISFKLLFLKDYRPKDYKVVIYVSLWVNYFIQSMISTDHLLLFLIGMLSAGTLVRIYHQQKSEFKTNENFIK